MSHPTGFGMFSGGSFDAFIFTLPGMLSGGSLSYDRMSASVSGGYENLSSTGGGRVIPAVLLAKHHNLRTLC